MTAFVDEGARAGKKIIQELRLLQGMGGNVALRAMSDQIPRGI